ncbi:hypothetical protein Aargi30884_20340 [Amedibacterium intestinale]|uniref:DUF2179 domain-containing protein n=1 Tax=Amedibacterium intestinale TaxID=2583452 RepID=A0A6N4TKM7_9FIRM|nr:YitT family protein [Amedibacterium intestinale]BBK23131.1 hypothetical protein Aargi30884_20340 [Amedibacterium intestinale]
MKKNLVYEYALISFATFVIAAAVYFFLIPSKVVIGSISGLAIVIAELVPLSISMITMILNVILLLIGFLLLGKEFGMKTVYTSLLMPIFIAVFEQFIPLNGSLTGSSIYDIAADILLVAFGQAILFNVNASSGGIDILAKILNKYCHIEIGKAVSAAGIVTAMTSILVYDIGTLIISILGTLANGQAVDYFTSGLNRKKKISIISDNYEKIEDYILHTMHRGVTRYQVIGSYNNETKVELVTIMDTNEYKKLLVFLHQYPEKVFVTVSNVSEILGEWNSSPFLTSRASSKK